MGDRFIFTCNECRNAISDGHRPLDIDTCPACGYHNCEGLTFTLQGQIK